MRFEKRYIRSKKLFIQAETKYNKSHQMRKR